MRGKLLAGILSLLTSRITPADAGKTSIVVLLLGVSEDHPRGCGENILMLLIPMALPGSPPRMRGKLDGSAVAMYFMGITPADAGKTVALSQRLSHIWDHPRGCGENHMQVLHLQRASGSPPRMRGKLYAVR